MGEIKDLQVASLKDVLELQKQLDKEISKKRKNGFVPRERNLKDMILSMIAEIIEFNEETKNTHKTWKEKDFNIDKMKEEAGDILFFYAQIVNELQRIGLELLPKGKVITLWDEVWEEDKARGTSNELKLIGSLTTFGYTVGFRIIDITIDLVRLYKAYDITKEEIYELYYFKWLKNIGRVEGDWTK